MSSHVYSDPEALGVSLVSSYMGHLEAAWVVGAEPDERTKAMQGAIGALPMVGLRAADQHLEACWQALDALSRDNSTMLSSDRGCSYRAKRQAAILGASLVVWDALHAKYMTPVVPAA